MNLHERAVFFTGTAVDAQIRGKHQISVERLVGKVEIAVDGDAPNGGDLTLKLAVGGTLKSQVYTLAEGQTYALIAVTGDGNGGAGNGLVVPANAILEVRIVTGSSANDVTVAIKSQMRVL